MGELRTRKRGKTWEWSFERAKIDGKRNPISKGGYRTKAEAIAAGTQAKAEYDNGGRVFVPSGISVSDYLDYWFESYVKKNLVYNSQQDYASKIRIHIKPDLGHYKLCSLEPDIIQNWIMNKKNSGMSKSMLKNLLACFSGALNYAVVPCKYIKSNPCNYVKIGKISETQYQKEHREYVLSKEEFEKIISRFGPDTNFYIPLMVAYHLGTRIGETYGFNLLEDIDFEKNEITISKRLACENKIWYYRPPKYNSIRTIKMDSVISNVLKQEILTRKKNQLRFGEYFIRSYVKPDGEIVQIRGNVNLPFKEIMPISTKESGELLTTDSFKYCARVIHNELNNPLFHSHCLRHTHGTILAENGVSPKVIMERLGHKDIRVTFNTYIFNTEKMQQDAIDIFEKAVMRDLPTA